MTSLQAPNILGQLVSRETEARPAIISDERLAEYLTAFGNHELKAMQVLAMEPEVVYTPYDLNRHMREVMHNREEGLGRPNTQLQYCQTLEKFGLVAKLEASGRGIGYKLTQEGVEYGKPLAQLLLSFGKEYDVALRQLFGDSMGRNDLRSPEVRLRLMRTMLMSDEHSATTLSAATGVHRNVLQMHLVKLATPKLIEYEEWDSTADSPTYRLGSGELKQPQRVSRVTLLAIDYLRDHESATLDELADYAQEQLRVEGGAELPAPEVLRYRLKNSINSLMTRDVIRATVKRRQPHNQAMLSVGQIVLWSDLLRRLEAYQSDPSTYAEADFMADNNQASAALSRAREHSPGVRSREDGQLGELVLRLLNDNEGLQTVRDLKEGIGVVDGRTVSTYGLRKVLGQLEKRNLITIQKKGRIYLVEKLH